MLHNQYGTIHFSGNVYQTGIVPLVLPCWHRLFCDQFLQRKIVQRVGMCAVLLGVEGVLLATSLFCCYPTLYFGRSAALLGSLWAGYDHVSCFGMCLVM